MQRTEAEKLGVLYPSKSLLYGEELDRTCKLWVRLAGAIHPAVWGISKLMLSLPGVISHQL
jgi:hypothetical protein